MPSLGFRKYSENTQVKSNICSVKGKVERNDDTYLVIKISKITLEFGKNLGHQ